ncbi:Caleosin related protein-domain-containing protein [Daldinia vernicosa]|uniref:Caleosin related protein-domain-containing protein n=1 Tax=Daldinia vernicosa TaxID=114800 RepID=UPI0020082E60|nr:Caleosin related protein-domain-containing protein [Daldinia vernicosa]KAI0848460.1 Caleosin related protein-domain-containing protein [Daldinia vernicosa]
MVNMKRSREAKRPASEHTEHFQRLRRRRLSTRHRDLPNNPSETIHGQLGRKSLEDMLSQQVDSGPRRRRVSAPEGIHRTPHEKKPNCTDAKTTPKTAKVPVLEKSEAEYCASDAIPPIRAIPWDLPEQKDTSNISTATYEPAYILRQNAEYFDADKDGIIWPGDTYRGYRKLGWGITYSCLVAAMLHSILSYPTGDNYVPDLLLRIRHDSNSHGKHSIGNASYDEKGQARGNQACENILAKYDKSNKGGMDIWDILRFWKDQRSVSNFHDRSLTTIEWLALYLALRHHNGIVSSEDICTAFDGSVLFKRSEERQRKNETRHKHAGSATRNGDISTSNIKFDPLKLAVVTVVGLAILLWILPGLYRDPSGWEKYWSKKEDTSQGEDWTKQEFVNNW